MVSEIGSAGNILLFYWSSTTAYSGTKGNFLPYSKKKNNFSIADLKLFDTALKVNSIPLDIAILKDLKFLLIDPKSD
jgi:hypothetical protein